MSSVWIVKIQAASPSKAVVYWQEATDTTSPVSTAHFTANLNIFLSCETVQLNKLDLHRKHS